MRTCPPEPMVKSSGSRPHADPAVVAEALALAFLAASDWDARGLHRAGVDTVGDRRALVSTAVLLTLHVHPRPPYDAPRALARHLRDAEPFHAALERADARHPVRVLRRSLSATRARPPEGGLPRIDDLAGLARLLELEVGELEWFADVRGWQTTAPAGPLHHYRYRWVSREGRTPRLLEAPLPRLRRLQRAVLDGILAHLPVHEAAHGFVPGRSVVTGAVPHVGRDVVVTADLVSCFAATPAHRIYGVLRRAGLPEPVAHRLTGLTTHAVPVHVVRAMPPGGTPEERDALRRALRTPHLPQGAPTSPALANLSLRRLDARLTGLAASLEATYTRYADDLVLSGDAPLAARVDAALRTVRAIVEDEGHALNTRKTRVRRRGTRQTVTGVVVNEHPGIPRRELDRLRAILHRCVLDGPAAAEGMPAGVDLRAHLEGRIGWVAQLDPAKGARLRTQFDRIRW